MFKLGAGENKKHLEKDSTKRVEIRDPITWSARRGKGDDVDKMLTHSETANNNNNKIIRNA